MRLCRFNGNRIGVVRDATIIDVTEPFNTTPTWPLPPGDWIVRQASGLHSAIDRHVAGAEGIPLDSVRLDCPVTSPTKVAGAPVNYRKHAEEAQADANISHGRTVGTIGDYGLFLKANSALIGPSEEVRLRFPDRRNDHEMELAVIIGETANQVGRDEAMRHVFGYAIGLDMTVRGTEVQSFRKSIDTYAVLGPWIVTADEIPDPNALALSLKVNGETRQDSNTSYMVFDVPKLIEFASSFYTLHPGDVIMTGTPEGVSQVFPGDVLDCHLEGVGDMRIKIAES